MAPYTFLIPETQECFIPLKARSKTPVDPGWPNSGRPYHEIDITKYNIGVLVGEQAGILDVDLDCFEANGLAEIILPTPSLVFNRGSADSAHYLYRGRSFGPCVQFASTTTGTLVELRGNGVQTMFPPSVHPNGSVLSCTKETPDADNVSYETLKKHVSLLAASAEVAQNWTEGHRHKLALAFSGLCSREGIPFDLLAEIIDRICSITGDIEIQDRRKAAMMSYGRPMGTAQGYLGLVELLGEQSASRIAERVRAYTKDETRELFTHHETNQLEFIRLDQFSDRTNLTEARIGNAFASWLDGKAVHVIESKQWMIWTGLYWELDQRSLMVQLAYAFVAKAKSELLQQGKHSDATNLGVFESLKKLENIVKLASTKRSVSKADFDTDPFLLVANNTWVDLKTGEEITPNPDVLVSKVLAVPYSSDTSCPLFLNFLDQVFEGDAELIRFVQKAVGYSLTGTTSEQCLFIMIGDGANGKSTFNNLISKLMGRYSTTAAAQTLIANGRGSSVGDDLVDLAGARLITVSETEEGQSLAEAKIKQMTGGDTLKARPLYGTYIEFNIIGKIWLSTNSLPQINNTDYGIWRRIMAIPFNRTFTADEQDKTLGAKLQAELPGILSWAIDGCIAWQEEGLTPPDIVVDQITEYKTAMDSIAQWVQDECELNAGRSYSASKLYSEYRDWCLACGRKPQSNTTFKRSLEKLDGVHQVRSANGNRWNGIGPIITITV